VLKSGAPMLRFVWIYLAVIAGAVIAATTAARRPDVIAFALGRAPDAQHMPIAAPATPSSTATPRSFALPQYAIEADRSGHYRTPVQLEGREIKMLVDTGASFVSLTKEDADSLGIRPAPTDYKLQLNTANGIATAAAVWLPNVRIGAIEVHDVPAIVMSAGASSDSLLGMSFLQRLRRFGVAGGKMVMEQ